MPNKKSSVKTPLFHAIIALTSAALCACQGPEVVPLGDIFPEPNASEYSFDVEMIAEWSGRLLPTPLTTLFSAELIDGHFVGEDGTNLDSILKSDGEKVYFHPYGTDDDFRYECLPQEDSSQYTCAVQQSGAAAFDETWKRLSKDADSKRIIRIGSGDNFGSSAPESKTFDDFPAIHLLNQFGLTAETLGNHAFDKTLDYLQKIIDVAHFPFVTSNLVNIPNNLEKLGTYKIINIPPSNGSGSDLPVALVGVIDENMVEMLSRGRLGTMDISDYCPFIHTMEEAYNKGARAFIILSHVTTDSEKIKDFFNALFSLDQSYAKLLSADSLYPCTSRLNVTQEMLDNYRRLNPKATPDDVRAVMRKDILDSIAFVYGESSADPLLTPLIPGAKVAESACPKDGAHLDECAENLEYLTYDVDGCKPSSKIFQFPLLSSASRLTQACNHDERGLALHQAGFMHYSLTEKELNNGQEVHPLWFTEIPPRGNYAAKATFKAVPADAIPGLSGRYRTQMTGFHLEPVFDNTYREDNYSASFCKSVLEKSPDSCKSYYQSRLQEIQLIAQNMNIKSLDDSKSICQADMLDLDESETISVQDIQDIWACLYYATKWEWAESCDVATTTADDTCFEISRICKLNYHAAGEAKDEEIRKFSTLIANLMTSIFLQYTIHNQGDASKFLNNSTNTPDILIINGGTIRESNDFDSIDNDLLSTALPYENNAVTDTLPIETVIKLLEFGLKNGKGAFPAIAGFHFSYETDKDGNKSVREMWKTDENEHFTELLYLSDHVIEQTKQNDICIFALNDDDACRFGEYTFENNMVTVELTDCEVGTFGCPIAEKKTFTYSQPVESLRVLMTAYMYGGGDGYNEVLGSTAEKVVPTSKYPVKDFVTQQLESTNKNDCGWTFNQTTFNSESLLKANMIKRIYSLSEEEGKTTDTPNSYCVAPQRDLAMQLSIYDKCHYE